MIMGKICDIPKSAASAVVVLSMTVTLIWWINWGFGLIMGAFLAKEMAARLTKKKIKFHYPLLAAGGYSGIIAYEMGITGAIPLWMATAGHALEAEIGVIPLSETVFTSNNLFIFLGILILVPLTLWLMTPKKEEQYITAPTGAIQIEEEKKEEITLTGDMTLAEKIDNSPVWCWFFGIIGLVWAVGHFRANGFQVDLNVFNLILLFVGLIAWKSPVRYAACFRDQTKVGWGIILQFHLYAGIMGMMSLSGLVPIIAGAFVAISTASTYKVIAFWSAGLVNFLVPSGGGQWAIQGPIMIEAAETLKVSMSQVAMAVGYGDGWTNLASPFWALPVAGVLGLKVRDFLGYTIAVMLTTGIFISIMLYIF